MLIRLYSNDFSLDKFFADLMTRWCTGALRVTDTPDGVSDVVYVTCCACWWNQICNFLSNYVFLRSYYKRKFVCVGWKLLFIQTTLPKLVSYNLNEKYFNLNPLFRKCAWASRSLSLMPFAKLFQIRFENNLQSIFACQFYSMWVANLYFWTFYGLATRPKDYKNAHADNLWLWL